MTADPDPIVTRSITVSELMDGDGNRYISIDTEGEPEYWDCLGLLLYALEWYKTDVAFSLDDADDD